MQVDAGFDIKVLADMITTLDRFADDELPVPDDSSAAELRAFYAAWHSELAAQGEADDTSRTAPQPARPRE